VRTSLFRAPGIYAAGRLPVERIRAGSPALLAEQDGYTNHIHADDLAMACALGLFRGRAQRAYNICDDSETKMGDWFDQVADALDLPRPPRRSREAVQAAVSPQTWSFMRESRRLSNHRLKCELRYRLRHVTPKRLLDQLRSS
jgi:nucleoside-diphosphate-sugar epimerase